MLGYILGHMLEHMLGHILEHMLGHILMMVSFIALFINSGR
jgi:hypothetical protein